MLLFQTEMIKSIKVKALEKNEIDFFKRDIENLKEENKDAL